MQQLSNQNLNNECLIPITSISVSEGVGAFDDAENFESNFPW